jgi:hypothetical protein
MFYYYHTPAGQVTFINQYPPSEHPDPVISAMGFTTSEELHPYTHYVENGALVVMPAQPSPNHVFDYVAKQWYDPRTLDQLKAEKWAAIKAEREVREYAGFVWDGSTFDSDQIAQARITGAVTLATLSSSFATVWTLADNTTHALNAAAMIAVGVALGTHVQTQFAVATELRSLIDAATTPEQLSVIGWPL